VARQSADGPARQIIPAQLATTLVERKTRPLEADSASDSGSFRLAGASSNKQ
jgi:hypothetical protein